METTVRETIKNTTKNHLKKNNGLVFGQCLTAVGWVGGTVPELTEKDGLNRTFNGRCSKWRNSCWSWFVK